MSPIFAIAVIWTWHCFWMAMLTYAVGRAAYEVTGWPVFVQRVWRNRIPIPRLVWPMSGRWMISLLFLMITLMLTDVARGSWNIWRIGFPIHLSWSSVILRAAPIIIEPACFWRQWRRGLVNDYQDWSKPA